ncbi:L,D-transpeptidase family protein [Chitinophaga japonensis]|uniref:Murein L,D-transpeptidase YcbB/YkuD n=1 Tax=Chitinophaga japonensis TaxID=104662 RepID=A0A562TDT6_CHIJA|nr:L,D-transpeptidase family protein [Chitinophaga japonensis]TWI91543.1 murein L,D-transpeptidase YcbB/YkuD [Chitinophaga japonensis]
MIRPYPVPALSNLFLPLAWCLLTIGCLPGAHNGKNDITPRNREVNKSNAYNNLFLDSTAMEKFIAKQQPDDTFANRMRSFYNARNFEYAWFDSRGLAEQALGFRSLYNYDQDTSAGSRQLENRLDELAVEEDADIGADNAGIVRTELQLTQRFLQYARRHLKDLRKAQLERFVPVRKQSVLQLAEAALDNGSDVAFDMEEGIFGSLEEPLRRYLDIARNGGWPALPVAEKQYRKGQESPAIALFKRRLYITGELPEADSSPVFNAALETAVKTFQARHGYSPTGIITDTLVREMNVTALSRVQQLLINMERMRWLPPKEQRLIIVNIPEFMLHVWEGKQKAFEMPVVVGKEGHSTTMFSGRLNQVVFNPYWHLPRSIVRNEVLPAMEKNGQYLEEHDMEITGERNGLPVIRQRPGEQNALGRVKFLFPNSFNIYLHDTPVKSLFNKDKRAYSHGCIRVSDPARLANYLLQDMPRWRPEKVDSALTQGDKEKYIKLKTPVPVLISYFTAWVDEQGQLQFREDIYGHDERLASKLFTDAQPVL